MANAQDTSDTDDALMVDLVIIVDGDAPPHALYISSSLRGSELTITVSPDVEAAVLLALTPKVADAVVEAVDNSPSKAAS